MKKLTITGHGGVVLCEVFINVVGDDINLNFIIPVFIPIVNISILEPNKKETKRIRATLQHVKKMVGKNV